MGGFRILKMFKNPHSMRDVSYLTKIPCRKLYDNYIRDFYYRTKYLQRLSTATYSLNKKGMNFVNLYSNIEDIDKKIVKLSNKGLTNNEILSSIRKKYNVTISNSTLYTKISTLRKNDKKIDRRKNIIKLPEGFDLDLSNLIAFLLSDGFVSDKGQIDFYNKDINLVKEFKKISSKIFGIKHFHSRKKKDGTYEISFHSIDIANYLKGFVKTFNREPDRKTKILPDSNVPKEVIGGSDELKREFIKYYSSCDGCISISISYKKNKKCFEIYPFISIACEHSKLRNQIRLMLESLGFNPYEDSRGIKLAKRKEILKYKNEIGFCKKCRISKKSIYWNGYTKNEILNLATKIIKYNLRNFKTKESIADYLKSFI